MEPAEITVIVCEGTNLSTKKKGKNKYHVVFGVGSAKFRTQTVQDVNGNPVWNEESQIGLQDGSLPLVFRVKDKDDVIGQVTVPLTNLPHDTNRKQYRTTLGPYKKCLNPTGELMYKVWVSKVRQAQVVPDIKLYSLHDSIFRISTPRPLKNFREKLGKISHSPILSDKPHHGSARSLSKISPSSSMTSLPGLDRKNSISCHDLLLSGDMSPDEPHADFMRTQEESSTYIVPSRQPNNTTELFDNESDEDDSPCPEVITATPAHAKGGVGVTISGSSLGNSRGDIVGLWIQGVSCLSTLLYVSSSSLYCVSKEWKSGVGEIIIDTLSGGRCCKLLEMPALEPKLEQDNISPEVDEQRQDNICSSNSKSEQNKMEKKPHTHHAKKSSGSSYFFSKIVGLEKKHEDQQKRNSSQGQTADDKQMLLEQMKKLKQENEALREQNASLKWYVDHLVAKVIEECPAALCRDDLSQNRH